MSIAEVTSDRPTPGTLRRGASQSVQTRIRELNACALRLPPGAYPLVSHATVYYLPLVRDEGHPWAPLVPDIRWMVGRCIIAQVCTTRAIETVDATLTIAGRRSVTPERYLRHWRECIAHSIGIEQAPWAFGFRPVARLVFDRRAVDLVKTRWRSEPVGGLAGLLERHQPVMSCEPPDGNGGDGAPDADAAQRMALVVDLTTTHGASDAWWLQEYLQAGPDNPHPLKAWVECLPRSRAERRSDTPQQGAPTRGASSTPKCQSLQGCAP